MYKTNVSESTIYFNFVKSLLSATKSQTFKNMFFVFLYTIMQNTKYLSHKKTISDCKLPI